MEERHLNRGGLVWPVILIGAGIVFLLNNLGVIGWGIWETLFRLWPVLLIAIGLDLLIGRRSVFGSLLVALLLVAVLAFSIWRGVPQWNIGGLAVNAVERTETVNEALQGLTNANIEIGASAGSLRIGALPEGSGELVKGEVDLSPNEQLEKRRDGSTLSLHSRNLQITGVGSLSVEGKVWDLALNRDIPLKLKVDNGVGRSTLDLTRLTLSALDVDSGVGETSVTLPRQGRLEADVNAGIGDVTIIIPQGVAAHIKVNGGLGNVSVSGDFNRREQEYTSPGFDSAQNRIELRVDGGIGRITIRQTVE